MARRSSQNITCLGNLSAILMLLWFHSANGNGCRSLVFNPVTNGKALTNHTIRTIQPIADENDCATMCYIETLCFTFNLCHKPGDALSCELTNSDHIRHEKDLVNKAGCAYYGTNNACSSSPCSNNATCQGDFPKDPVPYKCICPAGFEGEHCETDVNECKTHQDNCHVNATCINTIGGFNCTCKNGHYGNRVTCCWISGWRPIFDFEEGESALNNWTLTGTVFNNQPTYGNNSAFRGKPSNLEGDWWIGGAENRPSPSGPYGRTQGDQPKGTMTSPPFVIQGSELRFRIGGGCDIGGERAELLIGGNVVARQKGACKEFMDTRSWNVSGYHGITARLRLVDHSVAGWGHINFDYLEGQICTN